jgi:protein-tyrosine-phosphatase
VSLKAKVEAVSANTDHDFSKVNKGVIRVVRDYGVEADAHFGKTV